MPICKHSLPAGVESKWPWLKRHWVSEVTVICKNWAKIALYQSNSGKLKIIYLGFLEVEVVDGSASDCACQGCDKTTEIYER